MSPPNSSMGEDLVCKLRDHPMRRLKYPETSLLMTFRVIMLLEAEDLDIIEEMNRPEEEVGEVGADPTTEEGVDPLKETLHGLRNIMTGVEANHQTPDQEEIV